MLKDYLEYIQKYLDCAKDDEFQKNKYKNDFEKEVAQVLIMEGLEVRAGVEAAGVLPDLLVKDPETEVEIVVEIDGVDDNVKEKMNDTKKQTILERAGYKVTRISYREWQHSSQACVDRVKRLITEI